jgi:hypothetical protein
MLMGARGIRYHLEGGKSLDKHTREQVGAAAGAVARAVGGGTGLGAAISWGLMLTLLRAAPGEEILYVETHVHLAGVYRNGGRLVTDYDAAVDTAVASMNKLWIRRCLLLPPPFSPDMSRKYDYEIFIPILKKHPNRFAFLGGGGTLNPMIHEAVKTGRTTPELRERFLRAAAEILDAGALGFGEMATLHFSFFDQHPFEEAPPDHELFRLLADFAARRNVPIDLHMEPVELEMALPPGLRRPPNPERVQPNVQALERLLAHNREARILWAHAGWEHTGQGKVDLFRRLLKAHGNLYLSLKAHPHSTDANRPLVDGKLRLEWRGLICEFPDRFLLGSDQFYGIPGKTREFPRSEGASRLILSQLPLDVARKVASGNAERVYGLKGLKSR